MTCLSHSTSTPATATLDTDKVEIAVTDTGVGIGPEDQAYLFEEFKQLGKDNSRKAEGTGLGLALTKRLVQLHGVLQLHCIRFPRRTAKLRPPPRSGLVQRIVCCISEA